MIYGYLKRITEKRTGTTSTWQASAWRIVTASDADMVRQPYPRTRKAAHALAKELGITLLERDMSEDQYEALQRWAAFYGSHWKMHLRRAWENEALIPAALHGDAGLLRQLRNRFGPSWLTYYTLPKEV